jgi:hypothetical protein
VGALQSAEGRDGLAFALFALIAGTDYLDGMVARVTGQYSRLGALLDPLTDRLLVISGAIVAWVAREQPSTATEPERVRIVSTGIDTHGRPSGGTGDHRAVVARDFRRCTMGDSVDSAVGLRRGGGRHDRRRHPRPSPGLLSP